MHHIFRRIFVRRQNLNSRYRSMRMVGRGSAERPCRVRTGAHPRREARFQRLMDTKKMRSKLFTVASAAVPIVSLVLLCFADVTAFLSSSVQSPPRISPLQMERAVVDPARGRKNFHSKRIHGPSGEIIGDDLDAEQTMPPQRMLHHSTRRSAIKNLFVAIPATATGWMAGTVSASAVDDASSSPSLDDIARRFRRVPTFALVDGPTGTPFMILNNAGVATGYFFTSYEGAKIVLEDAKKDAAQRDLATADTWNNARITAVPLEFALKLAKARPKSKAQNGNRYDTVYDVIATAEDLRDAQSLDKSGIFTERGRVPLFYIDGLEIASSDDGGGVSRLRPVFLRKSDALKAWEKKFPGEDPPKLQVMELVRTFDDMLRSRGDGGLVMVPPIESRRAAAECEKSRGTDPAYRTGEMVAVGGK